MQINPKEREIEERRRCLDGKKIWENCDFSGLREYQ